MAGPYITVATPTRSPRTGGILSVAPVVAEDRLGVSVGVEWEANTCSAPLPAPGLCYGYEVEAEDKSAEEGAGWGTGYSPIAAYFGVECFAGSDSDFSARAEAGLVTSEGQFLDAAFYTVVLSEASTTLTAQASILEAVAEAENYADKMYDASDLESLAGTGYTGRPIIWMNRGDAVLAKAADAIEGDGAGALFTVNGTPVAAAGDIPAGTIYVSGQVTIYRSRTVTTGAVEFAYNREMAIAERVYAFGVDCMEPVAIPFGETDEESVE